MKLYKGDYTTMRPDANVLNADWTKQTFDIDGVTDVETLKAWLERTDITIEHFKALPVYKLNVDKPGMEWLKEL